MSVLSDMERDWIPNAQTTLHGHSSLTKRMGLQKTLRGHYGCVNRLAFSQDASLLLSGSDDCTLRIWSVESSTSVRHQTTVEPGHAANIFGVAFVPETDNQYVISAGHDAQVRHTHISSSQTTLWKCHDDVVKTVSPLDRNTFISASHDGTARLFDVRQPVTVSPTIAVRIASRMRNSMPLCSAIPSPVCKHHLLVAGNDARMRVFDLRCTTVSAGVNTPQGDCIEKYTPAHLDSIVPERANNSRDRRVTSTYANFSPDGKQIVASYFDDAVAVFQRHKQEHRMMYTAPIMSHRAQRVAIAEFSADSARHLLSRSYTPAVASANSVLQLDGSHIFALLCKAEALCHRRNGGDFRAAYATLQTVIDVLTKDAIKIGELWNIFEAPSATSTCSSSEESTNSSNVWKDKAKIWLAIFQYLQTVYLYEMVSPGYANLLISAVNANSTERLLTVKRLEYLNKACKQMEDYRDRNFPNAKNDTSGWSAYVKRRALSGGKEAYGQLRKLDAKNRNKVLSAIVGKYIGGIGKLRDRLTDSMSCLNPDGRTKNMPRSNVMTAVDSGESGWENDDDDDNNDHDNDGDGMDDDNINEIGNYGMMEGVADEVDGGRTDTGRRKLGDDSVCGEGDEEWKLWGLLRQQTNCQTFHGHLSKQTDIKEANFYGSRNQYVLSGSDDGHVYVWSATTSALVARVEADEQIVNCVLPHPRHSMIIASGIDETIKVLSPKGFEGQ